MKNKMLDRGVLNRFLQSSIGFGRAVESVKHDDKKWQDEVLGWLGSWIEHNPLPLPAEYGFTPSDSRLEQVYEQLLPQGGMVSRVPYGFCDLMESDSDLSAMFDDLVDVLSVALETYHIVAKPTGLSENGLIKGKIVQFGSAATPLLFVVTLAHSGRRRLIKFITFNTDAAAALMLAIVNSAARSGDDVIWKEIWTDGFVDLVKMGDAGTWSVIHVAPGNVDRVFWDSVVGVFYPGTAREGGNGPATLVDAIRAQVRQWWSGDVDSYKLTELLGAWNVGGSRYLWLAQHKTKRNLYAFGCVVDVVGCNRSRAIAFMMAWNKRLGKDSVLGQLEPEIARQIVEDSAEQQLVATRRGRR